MRNPGPRIETRRAPRRCGPTRYLVGALTLPSISFKHVLDFLLHLTMSELRQTCRARRLSGYRRSCNPEYRRFVHIPHPDLSLRGGGVFVRTIISTVPSVESATSSTPSLSFFDSRCPPCKLLVPTALRRLSTLTFYFQVIELTTQDNIPSADLPLRASFRGMLAARVRNPTPAYASRRLLCRLSAVLHFSLAASRDD